MNFEFEIEFYETIEGRKPVAEFLVELEFKNVTLRNRIAEGINKLKNSAYHREPLSKFIGEGLYELRVSAGRVIYFFRKGRKIILLHGFIKKKQKTPLKELSIAKERMKDYTKRHGD